MPKNVSEVVKRCARSNWKVSAVERQWVHLTDIAKVKQGASELRRLRYHCRNFPRLTSRLRYTLPDHPDRRIIAARPH